MAPAAPPGIVIMGLMSSHRRHFHDHVNLFAYTVNGSTR
jgi:hypothetical protein